jgi:hypothetical protein
MDWKTTASPGCRRGATGEHGARKDRSATRRREEWRRCAEEIELGFGKKWLTDFFIGRSGAWEPSHRAACDVDMLDELPYRLKTRLKGKQRCYVEGWASREDGLDWPGRPIFDGCGLQR